MQVWGRRNSAAVSACRVGLPGACLDLCVAGSLHQAVARTAARAGRAHERLIVRRVAGLPACEQSGRAPPPPGCAEATQEPLEANGGAAGEHSNPVCPAPRSSGQAGAASVAARSAGLDWASIALVPLGRGGGALPGQAGAGQRRRRIPCSARAPTVEWQCLPAAGGHRRRLRPPFNPAGCRWRLRQAWSGWAER